MATQLDLEAKAVGSRKHSTALQQIISAPRSNVPAESYNAKWHYWHQDVHLHIMSRVQS